MKPILSSGVAWAMKSSTPASRAIVAAVRGLSPVTMTVRMPILRNSAKRSGRPFLDRVLELDDADRAAVPADGEGRGAGVGDPVGGLDELGRQGAVEAGARWRRPPP